MNLRTCDYRSSFRSVLSFYIKRWKKVRENKTDSSLTYPWYLLLLMSSFNCCFSVLLGSFWTFGTTSFVFDCSKTQTGLPNYIST